MGSITGENGDSFNKTPPPHDVHPPHVAPLQECTDPAEYSPEVLREFPDSYMFPFSDPEVYGRYFPIRKGSMRVPDMAEGPDWNSLSNAHKTIEIKLYPERCEMRRKSKLERLRGLMQKTSC